MIRAAGVRIICVQEVIASRFRGCRVTRAVARSITQIVFILVATNAVEAQQAPAEPAITPQQSLPSPSSTELELRARLERLEQQNREMMQALQRMQPVSDQGDSLSSVASFQDATIGVFTPGEPGQELFTADAAPRDAAASQGGAANSPQPGYRIASNLAATVNFKDGLFLWLDSPKKEFTMHLGAWMQLDNVFWDQSTALKTSPGARPGHPQGVA